MCGGTSRNDDERRGGICRLSATRGGQLGPQQQRREDNVGSPRLRFTSPVVARGAQNRSDHYRVAPTDGPASISACVRRRDLAVFDRVFPEAAAPRWAKASGRRIPVESATTVRYR